MLKNSHQMFQKWWKDFGEITISIQKAKNGKKIMLMMKENHLKELSVNSLWNQLLKWQMLSWTEKMIKSIKC